MTTQCKNNCIACGKEGATLHRMPTRYADDSKNFMMLCPSCYSERKHYWEQEWKYLRRQMGV